MKSSRRSFLLNPLSMLLTGLLLGIAARLFDIYFQNLGEIFSKMAIWILLGTLIAIYSPTKKAATAKKGAERMKPEELYP